MWWPRTTWSIRLARQCCVIRLREQALRQRARSAHALRSQAFDIVFRMSDAEMMLRTVRASVTARRFELRLILHRCLTANAWRATRALSAAGLMSTCRILSAAQMRRCCTLGTATIKDRGGASAEGRSKPSPAPEAPAGRSSRVGLIVIDRIREMEQRGCAVLRD